MTRPAEQLAAEGVTVVRGFLTPDAAAGLRRTVYEVYALLSSSGHVPDRRLATNFRVWDGVWLKALPSFLRQARPDLADHYEQALRFVEAQVKRTLGNEWRFFPKRSYFRRHLGMSKKVGWHADADGATIFKVAASVINVWLPLEAVGGDLPSLEVVPRSHTIMRGVPMLTGTYRARDDAFVSAAGEPSIPQLQLGDALIFDQFVLHRTQNAGAPDAVRTSCEFRFARRSAPRLQTLSGWARYHWGALFSSDGVLATTAKRYLSTTSPAQH
jgi:hypothetical protein